MRIEVTLPQDVKTLQKELSRLRDEQDLLQSQLAIAKEALKVAGDASHESGCLGNINNDSCDCSVLIAREALEKLR